MDRDTIQVVVGFVVLCAILLAIVAMVIDTESK